LAVVVLLGVACSIVIQRSITHPLSKFMHFVQKVGTGDLTQRIEVYGDDEVARMGRSLNDMVEGLRDVAQQTREATQHLSSATAEILASTQQQAASSAQQASATQETNATMEEVRQSGSQIAERAKQVAAGAELTSTRSAAGLTAVQDTNQIMERIREQAEAVAENVVLLSEKTQVVGEIIATVNDIAEQSHLLALNAAIEAATAGEHGRGFFVVANEIKNLADQSKEATTQVRTILGDIQKGINSSVMLTEEAVKRVDAGKHQSDIAHRPIHDLTANVTESIQVFQQIVAGTGQQQIGFDQVVNALNDIGQATEQTAVGTHQLEKAAANLNAISAQLRKAVERYKV
jgi:methyl-accepting chemotaxis protein